jgi:hypothetical protein
MEMAVDGKSEKRAGDDAKRDDRNDEGKDNFDEADDLDDEDEQDRDKIKNWGGGQNRILEGQALGVDRGMLGATSSLMS